LTELSYKAGQTFFLPFPPQTPFSADAESITFYFNCHVISTVKNMAGLPSYKTIKETRNIRRT